MASGVEEGGADAGATYMASGVEEGGAGLTTYMASDVEEGGAGATYMASGVEEGGAGAGTRPTYMASGVEGGAGATYMASGVEEGGADAGATYMASVVEEGGAGLTTYMASDVEEGGAGAGAGEVSQVVGSDGVEEGGAGEMSQIVPAAGFLPKMLFYEGSSVVTFGIGALVERPKGIWSRNLLSLAYYPAVLVLIFFGVWLLKLSFVEDGNPKHRTLAKAVMWATLAPLLLVIALCVLANPKASP